MYKAKVDDESYMDKCDTNLQRDDDWVGMWLHMSTVAVILQLRQL